MAEFISLDEAVRLLNQSRVVGFPTETVYGLGGLCQDSKALEAIYAAKGRPKSHPLILHLAAEEPLEAWTRGELSRAEILAQAFWPGPLTLILEKSASVSDLVTGSQTTVALRKPSHPLAQELLAKLPCPLAGPSANKFGRVSPTRVQHVLDDLGSQGISVLDGGPCQLGLESTILDISQGKAALLRQGSISRQALEKALGESIGEAHDASPRAPGSLSQHYAPKKALELIPTEQWAERTKESAESGESLALLARPQEGLSPEQYGRDLYAKLRDLDRSQADKILVEEPPREKGWEAVWDRLAKASGTRP